MMVALFILIGGLTTLCCILIATTAYAMGEVKGLTKGYDEGQKAGYYHGYIDGLACMKDKASRNTDEYETVIEL